MCVTKEVNPQCRIDTTNIKTLRDAKVCPCVRRLELLTSERASLMENWSAQADNTAPACDTNQFPGEFCQQLIDTSTKTCKEASSTL
jgi:hypothetical protein